MVALNTMMQLLQLGYAPNEPSTGGRSNMTSDLERAIAVIAHSATIAVGDNIYGMILEYVRTYSRNMDIKLFWTNTSEDWPDVLQNALLELITAINHETPTMTWVYLCAARIRLINDVFAEERVNDKITTPGSLHHALHETVSYTKWKKVVNQIFKAFATKDISEGGDQIDSSPPKSQTKSANGKNKSTVDSASLSTPMDTDPPEPENWISRRLESDPVMYDIRMSLIELLDNLYRLILPTNPDYLSLVQDQLLLLPSEKELLFVIKKFTATPETRILYLDALICATFVRNPTKNSVPSLSSKPSVAKVVNVYWNLRPVASQKRENRSRKSSYAFLSFLLLQILDTYDYPTKFSSDDVATCVELSKQLYDEVMALDPERCSFTKEEIDSAVDHSRDLLDFVSTFSGSQ